MDKSDRLGFSQYEEKDMVCSDCIYRAELHDLISTKCDAYVDMKPMGIILGMVTKCPFKTTIKDIKK